MRTMRRQSSHLQRFYSLYKDLQKRFFPALRRKVITPKPQSQIKPASIQTRPAQPRISYASVTRIVSGQSTIY